MKVPLVALMIGLGAGFLLAVMVRPGSTGSDGGASGSDGGRENLVRRSGESRSMDFSETPTLAELEALVKQSRDKASKARLTLAMYKLSGSDIQNVMNELREKIDSGKVEQDTYTLQNQLLGVWMELNPDATFEWIESMPSISRRQGLYGTALAGLAEADPNAAISLLSSIPEDLSSSSIAQRLMWSMVKGDPDAAIEFYRSNKNISENDRMNFLSNLAPYKIEAVLPELEKMGPSFQSPWAVENIFQSWARQDVEAVKAYIESTDSDILKSAAIEAAAGQLAKKDPAGAIAMIKGLGEKEQIKGLKSVYATWLDHQPDEALASLAAIDDKNLKEKVYMDLVDKLDWRNPKAAVSIISLMDEGSSRKRAINSIQWAVRRLPFDEQEALIRKLPEDDRGMFLAGMASEMVRTDVERGMNAYLEMNEKDRGGSEGAEFLGNLSRIDPDRAIELAGELPNAAARNRSIRRIVESVSATSPEKAVGMLGELKGDQQTQAVNALANNWANKDADAALVWAEGLSGKNRVQAMVAVSARQSENKPTEAAATFETALISAPEGMSGKLASSANQIARNFANDDGPAAADWAASLGNERVAKSAVSASVQEWARKDLVAASEWTNALDDGPVRDSAVHPIVQNLQEAEPAAAIEWAASMADDGARKRELRNTLTHWQNNDPDAAREGLDNAGLDQDTYTELLKVFD